jgi:argininosuccinate synthase
VAGENGIGVVDLVENRLVGMKSRGVYETPGGTLLYEAHAQLERLTVDKDAYHYKQVLALKYSELVYDGLWFTTTREALDAFVDTVEENVTGTVKLKLYKGNMKVSSVESENALYDEGISSFGASDLYDHKDAQGFINLFSLPSKIKAMKKLEKK